MNIRPNKYLIFLIIDFYNQIVLCNQIYSVCSYDGNGIGGFTHLVKVMVMQS